jgi:hypothetical protein
MLILGTIYFGVGHFIGEASMLTPVASIVVAACVAAMAIAVVVAQALSVTIIGPDRISYSAAFPWLSWSVPFDEMTRCALISERAKMMHIATAKRSRTLILTNQLWRRLLRAG